MLDSARRHCMLRLHFRPRRFCRWCASDASYESVGNAGSIDETTSDIPLRTDSVKRCKGCPGIIESEETVWRDKKESVSHACGVRISAHHPIPIVISKQD